MEEANRASDEPLKAIATHALKNTPDDHFKMIVFAHCWYHFDEVIVMNFSVGA